MIDKEQILETVYRQKWSEVKTGVQMLRSTRFITTGRIHPPGQVCPYRSALQDVSVQHHRAQKPTAKGTEEVTGCSRVVGLDNIHVP